MTDLSETINGFDVWHLQVPVVSKRDHGIGAIEGTCEIVVLRLTSESGHVGYGEASPWSVFTGSAEAAFAALDRYMRPHVVGQRISDIPSIMAMAQRCVAHCSDAKAALESALLDLAGQISGQPVWALLGGKCRDEIPLSVSIANPDFDADLELMDRIKADGVRLIKLKTGFKDHAFDIMRLERIARDHPEFNVRVDFNQGLEPFGAVGRVQDIASFKPEFIEQPVRAHHYDLMSEIRGAIDVPLLADESVFGPEDMTRAIREGICDGVSIKIMKSGGLTRARTVAQMAAAAGLSAYGGDMFETGLAHLAGTHMIAATPEITLGCEFYHAKYYLTQDILTEAFPCENGHVQVPNKPGLGITPNMDKVAHYAVHSSVA